MTDLRQEFPEAYKKLRRKARLTLATDLALSLSGIGVLLTGAHLIVTFCSN